MTAPWPKLLKDEFRLRIVDESFNRIRICLSMLDEEDLYYSPEATIPSVSKQIRHICGNIRQWILASMGGEEDTRDRDSEFENRDTRKEELLGMLSTLENDLAVLMESLPEEEILKEYHIQGFKVNGLSAMIHAIEHCSYHTGQITLLTKMISGKETNYYAGRDLNVHNE